MDEIPITFDHSGITYSGHFIKVRGADGQPNWILRIKSNIKGSLVFYDHMGWIFHEEQPNFAELADYFVEYLTAWYDGSAK